MFKCLIQILNWITNLTMLTWLNQSTTGEHFAILCDYKPRINASKNISRGLIIIYYLAFLPSFCVSVRSIARQRDVRCSSPCILHTFWSVNPPHGQWPAPIGSLRVLYFIENSVWVPRDEIWLNLYYCRQ